MQANTDSPNIRVTGKSKCWMIGFSFLIAIFIFIALFIVSLFYEDLLGLTIACPMVAMLCFYVVMFTMFCDVEVNVTYDPNAQTLTIVNVCILFIILIIIILILHSVI